MFPDSMVDCNNWEDEQSSGKNSVLFCLSPKVAHILCANLAHYFCAVLTHLVC